MSSRVKQYQGALSEFSTNAAVVDFSIDALPSDFVMEVTAKADVEGLIGFMTALPDAIQAEGSIHVQVRDQRASVDSKIRSYAPETQVKIRTLLGELIRRAHLLENRGIVATMHCRIG